MIKKYNTLEEKQEAKRESQRRYKAKFSKQDYNSKERDWEANRRHYFEEVVYVSKKLARSLNKAVKVSKYESVDELITELMQFWMDSRKPVSKKS